ncbi:isoprenoid synthase domain-containing protein [Flagelloscypha sp. PMI_526]|nr:isoprenoid synthase domain-containing protein [Flagelloscypha sp. PMI_526]
MSTQMTSFTLPRTFERWPFLPILNKHWSASSRDSGILSPSPQWVDKLISSGIDRLAAWMYPFLNKKQLELATSFLCLTIVIDHLTDGKSVDDVEIMLGSLEASPTSPDGSSKVINELNRRLWNGHTNELSNDTVLSNVFPPAYRTYLEGVIEQARIRSRPTSASPVTLEEYLRVRRGDVAADAFFALCTMSVSSSTVSLEDMQLEELNSRAAEMLILNNDIMSFKKEYMAGDMHNAVAILMLSENLDIQESVDKVAQLHDKALDKFLRLYNDLCSGDNALYIEEYGKSVAMTLVGLDEWMFETTRYFGSEGKNVKVQRIVSIEREE